MLLCAVAAASAAGVERGQDRLQTTPDFLPVDRAFVFSASIEHGRVVARWRMPPGYYLYRERLQLQPGEGLTLGPLATPPGKRIDDAYFGSTEVYYGQVRIDAPIEVWPAGGSPVTVRFVYQGCAEAGLCYPPQERTVTLAPAGEPPESANVP